MADDKKNEKVDKKQQEEIDETSLKKTIDSVSLDGIDSLLPKKETVSTKKSKTKTTTSLSGIDDISSYIQKQKAKSDRISPELLTARDGTDLLSQEGVYAIVPHKKNDHKIVYTRQNAPNDLLNDPKNRKKGGEYKKNSMKIYDVHVDYAEHPTLKSPDGKPLDVWIIDDPKDLEDQLQAIRDGKGGGTNFMSPILSTQTSSQDSQESITPQKREDTSEEENISTGKNSHTSLDDILPVPDENNTDTQETQERTSQEKIKEEKPSALSLDDILPVGSTVETKEKIDDTQEVQDKTPKDSVSLDDILPQEGSTNEITSQEDREEKEEVKNTTLDNTNEFSLDDILPKQTKEEKKSKEESSKIPLYDNKLENPEETNETNNITNDTVTKEVATEDIPESEFTSPETTKDTSDDIEVIEIEDDTSKQQEEPTFELPEDDNIQNTENDETHEEDIEIPSLDEFVPKETTTQPNDEPSDEEVDHDEVVTKSDEGDETTIPDTTTNDWSEGFSAEDLLPPSKEPESVNKDADKTYTPTESNNSTPDQQIEQEEGLSKNPKEAGEVVVSEVVKNAPEDKDDDLIDLDSMTFEPITQSEGVQTPTITVHNDGIIGNENESTSSGSANIGLLVLKIVVALFLLGIAGRIVSIMVGGSQANPPEDVSPSQQEAQQPQQENNPTQEPEQVEEVTNNQGNSNQNSPEEEVQQPTPNDTTNSPDTELTPPETIPEQTFTLPELLAKIEAQQIEARRLLNRAKLLNSREGIKFATAGFIKSSKSLDEAAQDPTITADELQRDAQRIDLYLGQAQSILEN